MHIGGHVDWESDRRLIGARDGSQILYDVLAQRVIGALGGPDVFPKPGGDIALSPDGEWFVNGHGAGGKNYYTILRRDDGAWTRHAGFDQGGYTSGELRIDPSPCWNRDGTRILVVAVDARRTARDPPHHREGREPAVTPEPLSSVAAGDGSSVRPDQCGYSWAQRCRGLARMAILSNAVKGQ